jgi:hypothetical protein
MLSTDSQNNPVLFTPTKVEALRAPSSTPERAVTFCVNGRAVAVGETVTVPAHLAKDLVAVGKAKIVG